MTLRNGLAAGGADPGAAVSEPTGLPKAMREVGSATAADAESDATSGAPAAAVAELDRGVPEDGTPTMGLMSWGTA